MASASTLPYMPEILRLICEQLSSDQHALTVLARTSKSFEEAASNVLWSVLDGFYPLAKTLPSKTWVEEDQAGGGVQVFLNRPLDAKECTRFLHYGKKVRSFRFHAHDGSLEWVDITVFQGVLLAMEGKKVLPNMQRLLWDTEDYPDYFPFVHMFLGPHLTSVDITFATESPFQLSLLSVLRDKYPLLQDVTLSRYPANDDVTTPEEAETVLPIALKSLHMWQNLQTLEVPALTMSALMEAAQLPNLSNLMLTECKVDIPSTTVPIEGGFLALQDLNIWSITAENCMTFLEAMNLSQVNSANLQFRSITTGERWNSLFDTVSRRFNHANLTIFVCSDGEGHNRRFQRLRVDRENIHYEHIRPLLAFSNLSCLVLTISRGFSFLDTSIMTKEMATSWRNLENLFIAARDVTAKCELTDLLHFAEHCPNLTQLGIPLDATSPPGIPFQWTENRICQTSLIKLHVGDCPIKKPPLVAAFLSRVFPSLAVIDTHQTWGDRGLDDIEERVSVVYTNSWKQVSDSILVFSAVRDEERLYIGESI